MDSCCVGGFTWGGTPTGRIDKLVGLDTYVAGSNSKRAILLIHDVFGWTYANTRLLADQYAAAVDATVYLPDFFHGEVLAAEPIEKNRFHEVDMEGFIKRNGREVREAEIFASARELRKTYDKIGAIGYCYGGWAVFRLGAKEHKPALVDCISTGHPSLLTESDINNVGVPVQILAPEIDPAYTKELKIRTFKTIPSLGLPFDYQHFPGVEHACLVRGSEAVEGERRAMVRGKDAAISWFRQFLHEA